MTDMPQSLPHPDPPETSLLFRRLAELLKGGSDAAKLTQYLTETFPDLGSLLSASPESWAQMPLAGNQFPVMLQVIRECALRYNRACLAAGNLLADESGLLDYLTARLGWEQIENFHLLFLDRKNRLIADEIQGSGTVNHAPVYPREVARKCLLLNANGLIMAHNHPSGDATPSPQDVVMTQQVEAALKVIGVRLINHYIIGRGSRSSFRNLGLLEPAG
ncbi:JAB domain-containing protein [Oecophyllibacter saccharovorans]|uniref:JAB domain-containing protein n=1 Tax=Oecophyllibacter saccharovorans TaxID=2558360 RepID=UPI00117279B7|nr:DNA repair protein RadC [Oecophyllibacter saccharovorans]TPW34683.1 DNA repair protein RadC [Oecophyllibacter saccharovorans]